MKKLSDIIQKIKDLESKSLEINTIVHLIIYPGIMINRWIRGRREGLLPPVTAVLLFFSIFVLSDDAIGARGNAGSEGLKVEILSESSVDEDGNETTTSMAPGLLGLMNDIFTWTHLYENPDKIDSKPKQIIATAESWVRSQGIFTFFGLFIVFYPAMAIVLRRRYTFRESAVVSAYLLCQLCILKVVTLLVTLGASSGPGLLVTAAFLTYDFHQLLDLGWRPSLRYAIKVGLLTAIILAVPLGLFATIVTLLYT